VSFNKTVLQIDNSAEIDRICEFIRQQVAAMKRDGIIIGHSGGIDSATCAELCVRAIGKDRILALLLPEKESNPVAAEYAIKHIQKMGLNYTTSDITGTLEGFGTYEKRDKVICAIFPDLNSSFKSKVVMPSNILFKDTFSFFTLKVEDSNGNINSKRLNNKDMRSIIAAANTKQRTRMLHLYYYGELNNYLVCGTTNRTEEVLGFFVKYGDGGVDIEPIAHLYKTQVFQLASHLGVIDEIIKRSPSPDTFSSEVTDEEMYFRIPFNTLDLLLYAWENDIHQETIMEVMDLTEEQIASAFRDFGLKHSSTKHIREMPPVLE
jgi:NAD+ synthase